MRKKDFIALANYLNDESLRVWCDMPADGRVDAGLLRTHLANFCHSVNPRFKRDRWLAYIAGECGPNGGKVRKVA